MYVSVTHAFISYVNIFGLNNYTCSPPPYLIPDLSLLFCLKYTLYSVHPCIYLQFLFAYNGPINQNNQLWLGGSKLHSKL